MNLEILKDYFSFLGETQSSLQNGRKNLPLQDLNAYSFYKLIAAKSQPQIDQQLMLHFIKSFTYNFQVKPLHEILSKPRFQMFPPEDNSSQEELLARGVDLFLRKWSNSGQLSFQEFAFFLKGEEEFPSKAVDLDFPLKKRFYQILQDEIQNLLDAQTFRKTVALYYKNLVDLFEVVSHGYKLQIEQIKNLFLKHGERRQDYFYQNIAARFTLPMEFSQFKKWFTVATNCSKYKQQTKIFYSSIKKKKQGFHYDNQDRFATPSGKTTAAAGLSSTKMTKGQRFKSIQRQGVQVSRFALEECAESRERREVTILSDILRQEEKVNEMKRQLLYQQDYDLQLIYERKGQHLEDILNNRYGTCNFTSFIRYMVPQDYDHRYYAFIKYNKENKLSEETSELIESLIDEQVKKENKIGKWWREVDPEIIFRGYCNPGDKSIHNKEMKKYFTERECKVLLDRLDPNKTGSISLEYFK